MTALERSLDYFGHTRRCRSPKQLASLALALTLPIMIPVLSALTCSIAIHKRQVVALPRTIECHTITLHCYETSRVPAIRKMSEAQKVAASDPAKPLGEIVDVSKPCTAPERIEHHGRYCNLIPWTPAHTEEMFPLMQGPENESIFYYWPGDPYPDVKAFEDDMKDWYDSVDPLCWAIVDLKSGQCQGQAILGEYSVENRNMESGMFITLPLQQTTAATEAFYLIARYTFDLGFRRLAWKTSTVNTPSRRAAERYGMRKWSEGLVNVCSG